MNDLVITIALDSDALEAEIGKVSLSADQTGTAPTSVIGALAGSFAAMGQLMAVQMQTFAEELNHWVLSLRRTADILGEFIIETANIPPVKMWLAYARKAQREEWRQYQAPVYHEPSRWHWRPDFGMRRIAG